MSERMKGGPGHGYTWEEFENKFGKRIAGLEEDRRQLIAQVAKLEREAAQGRHFKMLMDAVKSNPLVKKEWDRFLMTLRMVGMDNSTPDAEVG
jgi:hypothetical protein